MSHSMHAGCVTGNKKAAERRAQRPFDHPLNDGFNGPSKVLEVRGYRAFAGPTIIEQLTFTRQPLLSLYKSLLSGIPVALSTFDPPGGGRQVLEMFLRMVHRGDIIVRAIRHI